MEIVVVTYYGYISMPPKECLKKKDALKQCALIQSDITTENMITVLKCFFVLTIGKLYIQNLQLGYFRTLSACLIC